MKKPVKAIVYSLIAVITLLIVLLILPFLIDLNKFKPQIQDAVRNSVNANLDFESARLQIFPTIGVNLKKVTIENTDEDFKGTKLFAVGNILIDAKFWPLLKKKLVGQVIIQKPELVMAKKGLKNNLGALAKPSTDPQPAATPQAAPKVAKTKSEKIAEEKSADQNMQMLKESVLIETVRIEHANLTIKDLATVTKKDPVHVEDFNLTVTNIGLDRDILTEISSKIAVNDQGISTAGIFKTKLMTKVSMAGSGLKQATFDLFASFDDLSINFRQAFVKAPGIPLNLKVVGIFKPDHLQVDQMEFHLHNFMVSSVAVVDDFKQLIANIKINAENGNLSSLGDVLPQHKNMLVNGSLKLNSEISGKLSAPNTVKARAELNARLTGSDIGFRMNVDSIEPMKAQFDVQSTTLNIGQILKPFMPQQAANNPAAETVASKTANTTAQAPPEQPKVTHAPPAKDFELAPEQKKMLLGSDILFNAHMGNIIYDDIDVRDFIVNLNQKSLVTQLNQFSVKGFGGQVAAKGIVNLEPSPLTFSQDFKLTGVQPEKIMVLIKPEHKDVLKGKMDLQLDARGAGSTVPTLNKTLNGKGEFRLYDAQINTPSIAKVLQKEFDQYASGLSVSGAADQIFKGAESILKNPMLDKLPNKPKLNMDEMKAKYNSVSKVSIEDKASVSRDVKEIKGKIEIKDGRIYFDSKNTTPSGDMNILASVGLDMTLGGTTTYVASEGTKKRMLSQSPYASLLFDKNQKFSVDALLSGTVTEPKIALKLDQLRNQFTANARALVEREVKKAADDFVKGAMNSQKEALQAEFKKKQDELKGKIDEERKKQEEKANEEKKKAQDQLKDQAKDKLKGLFGN